MTDAAANFEVIRSDVKQRSLRGIPGNAREDRNLVCSPGTNDGFDRRQDRDIAADPKGIDAALDERQGGFIDGRSVVRVGLEQLNPQLAASVTGQRRAYL